MYRILLVLAILFSQKLYAQCIWLNQTKMKGTIGKYPVVVTLAMPDHCFSDCATIGEYYYTSKNKKIDLCDSGGDRIVETADGRETGYFILNDWDKKVGQTVTGTWYTMSGDKSFPVTLKVISKKNM